MTARLACVSLRRSPVACDLPSHPSHPSPLAWPSPAATPKQCGVRRQPGRRRRAGRRAAPPEILPGCGAGDSCTGPGSCLLASGKRDCRRCRRRQPVSSRDPIAAPTRVGGREGAGLSRLPHPPGAASHCPGPRAHPPGRSPACQVLDKQAKAYAAKAELIQPLRNQRASRRIFTSRDRRLASPLAAGSAVRRSPP